jgi:thiamine biosynthesis lipoprotein
VFAALGGEAELRLAGISQPALVEAAAAARAEISRIEQVYSRYRIDSVVSCINATAGTGCGVRVDNETCALLNFADSLFRQSQGLFDITSGVWRKAWDFRSASLPSDAHLAALRPCVGWEKVRWDGESICLPRAGMELDFGGFGKEYAADRAAAVLMEHGVNSGYVNLAGDIRVLGPRSSGQPWQMGIQHPRAPDALMAHAAITEGGLATSGDYERYFELDGQRYCHLINPQSGWPVQHWQSISVVAPLCIAAGSLSTCAMLMGAAGTDWLRAQGARFLAVDAQGRTEGHLWTH